MSDFRITSFDPSMARTEAAEAEMLVNEQVSGPDSDKLIEFNSSFIELHRARVTTARTSSGHLAGVVVTTLSPTLAPVWVSSLAVRSSERGAGLGTALVRHAMIDRLETDERAIITLAYIRVSDGVANPASFKAFLKAGFVLASTIKMPVSQLGPRAKHWTGTVDLAVVAWTPGAGSSFGWRAAA